MKVGDDQQAVLRERVPHAKTSHRPAMYTNAVQDLLSSQSISRVPCHHIAFSVVSLLFCLPLAIGAIMQGLKVRKANLTGNFSAAYEASIKAQQYSLLSVYVGTLLAVFIGAFTIVYLNPAKAI